jgi:hypothetical protein
VGLKVFPPQRNNLVVAILDPAPAWHILHKDIRQLSSQDQQSKALAEITKFSKEKWVSHVTLGNLYGRIKPQIRSLDSLLERVFGSKKLPSKIDGFSFEACTSGITMGGPIPEQVKLDWDFRYVRDG